MLFSVVSFLDGVLFKQDNHLNKRHGSLNVKLQGFLYFYSF